MGVPRSETNPDAEYLLDHVCMYGASLYSGDSSFPYGLDGYPVSNISDAITIANLIDVKTVKILPYPEHVTELAACDSFTFIGEGGFGEVMETISVISLADAVLENCRFDNLSLYKGTTGDGNTFNHCMFYNNPVNGDYGIFSGLGNTWNDCLIRGAISPREAFFKGCKFDSQIRCYGNNMDVETINLIGCSGKITIYNNNVASKINNIYIRDFNGEIIIDNASNASGLLRIVGGKFTVTGEGAGMTIQIIDPSPSKYMDKY